MRRFKRASAAIALVSVAALALAGCGGREDGGATGGADGNGDGVVASPGITDDTIKIGGSFPLSGPLSLPGQEQLYGEQAYFDAVNEAGGVTMGDGKTRKIEFVYYDDAYDPSRLVQNMRRLIDEDQVFATAGMFGTAANLAAMPVATEAGVPQVFLGTGASVFSADREANPYTLGWWPTYENEATTFGEYLVSLDRPITVAFMAQNDDQGEAYLEGLQSAIEGSQVEIIREATFEATDTVLDSPVSALAATGADAFFSAVNVPATQTAVLRKLVELEWAPITYIPIVTSNVADVVSSGAHETLTDLFSSAFSKRVCEPEFAEDDDVKQFIADLEKFAPDADECFANTAWGYAMGASVVAVLENMEVPTRDGFMEALKRTKTTDMPLIREGLEFDGGNLGSPPIKDLEVQKFAGDGWETIVLN